MGAPASRPPDDILFTDMTSFPLQSPGLFRTRCLDQLGEFEQVRQSEQGATCRDDDKCIHGSSVGPTCWHRLQAAVIVVKPNPVLAPVLTECYRFELLLKQRMVRVGYSETSGFKIAMGRI